MVARLFVTVAGVPPVSVAGKLHSRGTLEMKMVGGPEARAESPGGRG